jgi:hypothetical protein
VVVVHIPVFVLPGMASNGLMASGEHQLIKSNNVIPILFFSELGKNDLNSELI